MPVRPRNKRKRIKPEWQDIRPSRPGQKDAYQIAQRHERRFAQAYQSLFGAIFEDDEAVDRFEEKINQGFIEQALDELPFLIGAQPEINPVWEKFLGNVDQAYQDIVEESAQDSINETGVKANFVLKAEIPTLPPDPFAMDWIRMKSLSLAKLLSEDQKKVIRQILLDGYQRGDRVQTIMRKIELTLGLTPLQLKTINAMEEKLRDAGMAQSQIEEKISIKTKDMRRNRAEMIARTETVAAQAHGRNEGWKSAQRNGLLPVDIERQWVAALSSDRTCKICRELDSQIQPIGEPYESSFVGTLNAPPAHPQCRCVLVLVNI